MTAKTPVIFNHSAAIDDFVSTVVLSQMPDVEIQGIVVTCADCIPTPAMDVTSRVHQFLELDKRGIPLAMSNTRGWNAFPWEYKQDCITMGTIDILAPYTSQVEPPYESGEDLIANLLQQAISSGTPAVFLATGPITALTTVLAAKPDLAAGVKDIVWMGGAFHVPGNLDPKTVPPEVANKHAEWNAFWDPFAVQDMFDRFDGVKIFPLDVTDQAKITPEFKAALAAQAKDCDLSLFVDQAYALVKDEPFYEMWNTLATCSLGSAASEIFAAPVPTPLVIDKWGNETQGWIHEKTGAKVQLAHLDMNDPATFYEYVLTLLRKNT